MPGLYLEDPAEGRMIDAAWRRTVTEADDVLSCGLTRNVARLHLDADHGAGTEFGRPLVDARPTLGLTVGISVHNTAFDTTAANLGMTDVAFPRPVFAGDTLSARTTVVSNRPSRSRSDAGVVVFRHEASNPRGEVAATCARTALMRRHPREDRIEESRLEGDRP